MAPRVQFLFATTNDLLFQRNASALKRAEDYFVVNQLLDDRESSRPRESRILSVVERGLARSRNRALRSATAELCYLCDDDVSLVDGAGGIVARAFDEHCDADILIFPRLDPEMQNQASVRRGRWLPTTLRLLGVCSVEIGFRRASVLEAGVVFDERFGLGAPFSTSEEAIFLVDCLRAGLRIDWAESGIVGHAVETSGADYADGSLAVAKGAMLHRLFGAARFFVGLAFALKSYPLYRPHMGLFGFLAALHEGARLLRASDHVHG
ncbi:MAG: hypothetical protein CL908_01060 [Deltaproteobacteria bacterium]|nr:hypothetical protein [Deltaproteobacteria bacterium]